MLASHAFLARCFLLQSAVLSLASPLLHERGNSHHLKCTNAPTVVAGYYVDPKNAQPPSSASATCQAASQYLYCIPGTYTYVFFGAIKPSLQPSTSYATALNASIAFIDMYIGSHGDGPVPDGHQYVSNTGTGILIYAEDAGGHHLTWGVFGVAMQGLNAWMADTENGYSDAMFQINDGKNEVGNGYVGAVDQDGVCVFANAFTPDTPCVAVDSKGLVRVATAYPNARGRRFRNVFGSYSTDERVPIYKAGRKTSLLPPVQGDSASWDDWGTSTRLELQDLNDRCPATATEENIAELESLEAKA